MLTKEQVTQVLESANFESLPDYAVNFLGGESSEEETGQSFTLAEGIVRARPDLSLEDWPDTLTPAS